MNAAYEYTPTSQGLCVMNCIKTQFSCRKTQEKKQVFTLTCRNFWAYQDNLKFGRWWIKFVAYWYKNRIFWPIFRGQAASKTKVTSLSRRIFRQENTEKQKSWI